MTRTVPAQRRTGKPQSRLNGKPVTHSAAITTASLLDDIAGLLRRYVIFTSEHEPRLLALLTLFTYARDAAGDYLFYGLPYIYINSKGSNHGKSRLIELLRLMVCRPSEHLHDLTEAVIFRLIAAEKPVLFFDEIHRALGGTEAPGIIAILNAGIFRNGMTARCDPKNPNGIIRYPVGCVKVLAGRIDKGTPLPDDLMTRIFPVTLPYEPRASSKLGRRFEIETASQEAEPVNARCHAWAELYRDTLMSAAAPQYPESIADRTAEACKGLLVIAELAGQTWTDYAHEALTAIIGSETDDIPLDGNTFDDWVKTAFDRQYIAAGDYANRSKPPALCRERNISESLFGWPAKRAFTAVSVKTVDSKDTLRVSREDFPRFWKAVQRANYPDMLPEPGKVLRDLRAAGRMTLDGRQSLSVNERVWRSQAKQSATIVIDISHWYPVSEPHSDTRLAAWESENNE